MKNTPRTIANAFPKKQFYSTVLYLFLIYNYGAIPVKAQQEKPIPPITFENVPYGDHPNQVIDFRKANVEKPAPLVVFIHGGGFTGGSHDKVNAKAVQQYLDAGIHHASIEYRFFSSMRIFRLRTKIAFAHYSLFAQKQRNGELIKIALLDMEDLRGHSLLPT